MSRESLIVLGGMVAVVIALVVVRFAYEDVADMFYRPSAEELAQGEQAIGELQKAAESADPEDLIAAVAPCKQGSRLTEACVTVTPKWGTANNRQQMATDLWKSWASICTSRHLAEKPAECRLELRTDTGETVGGSGEDDGSRIWVRE